MEFDSTNISALTKVMSDLKGAVADLGTTLATNAKHAERSVEISKKASEASKNQFKWVKKQGAELKATAQYATGIQISLGSILKMLVDVWNLSRRIQGLARMAAGPLGTASTGIKHARTAMRDLRSQFRMSYDEAGKLTSQMTQLGLKAKDLAGHAYVSQAFSPKQLDVASLTKANKFSVAQRNKLQTINTIIQERNAISNIKKEAEEDTPGSGLWGGIQYNRRKERRDRELARMAATSHDPHPEKPISDVFAVKKNALTNINDADKLRETVSASILDQQSKHVVEQEKSRKLSEDSLKLETEWYALQTMKGISLQTSVGIYRTLRSEFSKTKEAADKMYGSVITSVEEMNNGQNNIYIGAQEYVQTWQQMIDKVRVFKTDQMGVLALQNTLLRKGDGGMGLNDAPQSVRLGIAQNIMDMPLNMDLGMKAFVGRGQGANPAEDALKFERMFESKDPVKIAEAVQMVLSSVSDRIATPRSDAHAASETFRARGLFEKLKFDPEQQKVLADAVIANKRTGKSFDKFTKTFTKELETARDNAKSWNKKRDDLVSSASKAATAIQSIDKLIKKWAEDKILGVLGKISSSIDFIADAFGGKAAREESFGKKRIEDVYGVKVSTKVLDKMVKTAREKDPKFDEKAAKKLNYNEQQATKGHLLQSSLDVLSGKLKPTKLRAAVDEALKKDKDVLARGYAAQLVASADGTASHAERLVLKAGAQTGAGDPVDTALSVIRNKEATTRVLANTAKRNDAKINGKVVLTQDTN